MRMAAIYARVSSQQQREENTIASQTAALIEFATGHNLEVPEEWVFEDEGYSGATLERPGLERVRDLAAEGQIQVVLAYAPDRLSRKYAYPVLSAIAQGATNNASSTVTQHPQACNVDRWGLREWFKGIPEACSVPSCGFAFASDAHSC
jgi:DNA invertase Pin-like site-specific DNA recombinase